MRYTLASLCLIFALPSLAAAAPRPYPLSPDPRLTPGSLCAERGTYRYPERIAYCDRAVGSRLKDEIVDHYDSVLGYGIAEMGRRRAHFKIDHHIPLCMGGSNEPDNLWPQHESVFALTDPLEPELCRQMAQGQLRQRDAIAIIRRAKADPARAPEIFDSIRRR